MHTTTHILITAATGKTGTRIHRRLTDADVRVRAVSRATDVPFHWEDPSTWDAVLDGIDVAYLAYSPDLSFPGSADGVGAFAARAVDHGVRRAVLLSGRGEEEAERAEDAVRAAGLPATVLRAAFMAQNFSETFLADGVRSGTIALPAPVDVGEPVVDAEDIADAAVAALLDPSHDGRTYELCGPRLLTIADMTAQVGRASGRAVQAVEVPSEAWIAAAAEEGLPPELGRQYAQMFATILDGRNAHVAEGVPALLGRPARDFDAYLVRASAEGAWAVSV